MKCELMGRGIYSRPAISNSEGWSVPGELLLPGASSWHVYGSSLLLSAQSSPVSLLVTFYHILSLAVLQSLTTTWLRSHQHPKECSRTHLHSAGVLDISQSVLFVSHPAHLLFPSLPSPYPLPLPALQLLITSCVPDGSLSFSLCGCSQSLPQVNCMSRHCLELKNILSPEPLSS